MFGMEFKKDIIITSKLIHGAKTFMCLWDMKDVAEMKIRRM